MEDMVKQIGLKDNQNNFLAHKVGTLKEEFIEQMEQLNWKKFLIKLTD